MKIICVNYTKDFIESENQYEREEYQGLISGNEYYVMGMDVDDFNYSSFGYYKIMDEKGLESWWCTKRFINKKI